MSYRRRFTNKNAFDINIALRDPQFQQMLLESAGIQQQSKAPKASFLDRILAMPMALGSIPDVLNDMRYGQNPISAYAQNLGQGFNQAFTGNKVTDFKTTQDLLDTYGILQGNDIFSKVGKFGVGLAGDIILDPTTYLGFGLADGLAKPATVNLFGKEVAKLPGVAGLAVESMVNPLGVGAKGMWRGAEKIAPDATDFLKQLFNSESYFKSKGLSPLYEATQKFGKEKTGQSSRMLDSVLAPLQKMSKELSPEEMKNVVDVIEGTALPLSDKVEPWIEGVRSLGQKTGGALKEAGVLSKLVEDYVPRQALGITEEGLQNRFGGVLDQLMENKKVAKELEKQGYVSFDTLTDIFGNKPQMGVRVKGLRSAEKELKGANMKRVLETMAEGMKSGVKYNENLPEVLANNVVNSTEALVTKQFIDELPTITDEAGNPYLYKIKKGGKLPVGYKRFESIKGLKGYAVPQEAYKLLKNYTSNFIGDESTSKLVGMYDKLLRMFKSSVTGMGPGAVGFNVRNLFGDASNHALAGMGVRHGVFNPIEMIKSYDKGFKALKYRNLLREAGEKVARAKYGDEIAELYKQSLKHGVVGGTQLGDALGTSLTGMESLGDKTRNTAGKIQEAIMKPQQFREEGMRIGNFYDHWKQTGDWGRAAQQAKLANLDYNNLTVFEKNVMKRVIPFYSFARKNLDLQLKVWMEKPGNLMAQRKFLNNLGQSISGGQMSQEDWDAMPDWMKQGLSFVVGREGDSVDIMTGFGDPTSAVNDFIGGDLQQTGKNLLSSLNPFLKIPLEQTTGMSTFTGRPIEENTSGRRYQDYPQFIKDLLGYRETTGIGSGGQEYTNYYVDPQAKYLVENMPLIAPVNTLAKRIYDVTGKEGDTKYLANLLSGGRIYEKNIERQKSFKRKQEVEEMNDILNSYGITQPSTGVYLNPALGANSPEVVELLRLMGYNYTPKSKEKYVSTAEKRREKRTTLDELLSNFKQ